jgi:hypothetical protein
MKNHSISRRTFVKGSVFATGASVIGMPARLRAAGASDRIRIGVVGVGGMGTGHVGSLVKKAEAENIQVVAVCDVYQRRVNRAKEICKGARLMAAGRFLSHGTPNQPKNTTPYDRLVQQGLKPRYSAENIALNFVLRIEPGKPFHTRKENGRTVYSYEAQGEPLVPHTYSSLAEAFVAQWMKSPLHRKNLLASEPESSGVGCALSKDEKGFDTVYANQNFFAPLPVSPVHQPEPQICAME